MYFLNFDLPKTFSGYIILPTLKVHTFLMHITFAGVHLRGGEGGPSPPLGSKFHIFLQSYCEMIKGIQHVHVL